MLDHLKREMAGLTASSLEDVLSEIRQNFEEAPKETLTAVYNKWITGNKGEYYDKK
jgi:hypothetical protein